MITLLVFLLALFLLAIWMYNKEFKKYNRHMEKFCGPPEIPFFGSALIFCSRTEVVSKLLEYMQQYKGDFKIRVGPIFPILVICDIKGAEFFLSSTKHITKSLQYTFFKRWLKNGLLLSTGTYWKRHRKIITPAFHFSIVEEFMEVFNSCGNKLVSKLKSEIGNNSFDIVPYVSLCSLDIICETAMGTLVNAQENSNSEYVKSVKIMGRTAVERAFSPLKMFDACYVFTSTYRNELKALKVLHGYSQGVIQQKKQAMGKSEEISLSDEFGIKKRRAFLDLLLHTAHENGELTDEEIQEEVDTFMFEGHDTTSSALSFAIYCLANNQEAQDKSIEELNSIFADDQCRECTFRDTQSMHYLEMVIKETLRLYPSVPILGRELMEDVIYDGKIVPKGCTVTICPFLLHRNPEIFPEPDRFDPERFADNTSRSPFAYVPFSAGMRNCIGQKFAMTELKVVLSNILRHYELLPVIPKHEVILSFEAIFKADNGALIRIKERQ